MPCVRNQVVKVSPGTCVGVAIYDNELGESAPIYYTVSQDTREPEHRWFPLYVDDEPLVLTAKNSPLILNVPGTYRIACDALTTGGIAISSPWPLDFYGKGDVR